MHSKPARSSESQGRKYHPSAAMEKGDKYVIVMVLTKKNLNRNEKKLLREFEKLK